MENLKRADSDRVRDHVEVEYKWLLVFDPANSQLPRPSENAKPLPADLARKSRTTAEDPSNDCPKPDDPFCDPQCQHVWSEFHTAKVPPNLAQVKVELSKPKTLFHYLGKTSTEAKAQYTANLAVPINDLAANFLESVKPPITAAPPVPRRSYPASYPTGVNVHALNAARTNFSIQPPRPQITRVPSKGQERPYNGKYAIKDPLPYEYKPKSSNSVDSQALKKERKVQQMTSMQPMTPYANTQNYRAPPTQSSQTAPMVPIMSAVSRQPSVPTNPNVEEYRRVSNMFINVKVYLADKILVPTNNTSADTTTGPSGEHDGWR